MTNHTMRLKLKPGNMIGPEKEEDIPLFKHCTNGFFELEIWALKEFIPVFSLHGVQVEMEAPNIQARKENGRIVYECLGRKLKPTKGKKKVTTRLIPEKSRIKIPKLRNGDIIIMKGVRMFKDCAGIVRKK